MILRRVRYAMSLTLLLASAHTSAYGQILEFMFNDTGTTSASTGSSPTVVTFYDLFETEADLHSAAGLGVAGDIVGHADFGTDRAFDNTASLGMQSVGGIALNLTDTSVSELDSWTVTGWYKTDGAQVIGGGGTVIFQSPPRYTPSGENSPNENPAFQGEHGVGFEGFALRGASANGFRTTVNGSNIAPGDADAWEDASKWVFFAVTYDGTESFSNLHYYRGYRSESEAGDNPLETTQTAFASHDLGATLPAAGIAMGNRTDDLSRSFDGMLDNVRVFGSRGGGDAALTLEQVEAIRAYDMAVEHLTGDYNSDGAVDKGDYVVWEQSLGATDYLYADGNGDGLVDAADYTVWRDNLGATALGLVTVPEPGAALLALVGLAPLTVGRRRSTEGGA